MASGNLKFMLHRFLLVLGTLFISFSAHALTTELAFSYGQKKTTFDTNNYFSSESVTGSMSLYFMEKLAVELSYTDATAVKEELVLTQQQTTLQKTKVVGADLIFIMGDRKSFFQPYLKGGVAQITRQQTIKIAGALVATLTPDEAMAPSYGAGFRLSLTDEFGIKVSYDVWKTPIGSGQTTDDAAIKVGVSWYL